MDKYFEKVYGDFEKAVKEFELIEENDCIAVCISGGKDSMLLSKCMQKYREDNGGFSVINLLMDPGYREQNRTAAKANLDKLSIEAEIFESEIFDAVESVQNSPCYLCARMRRGTLYAAAKARGANKIALGHHFDDVIETVLMGVIYNGQVQSMPPKLKSKNFENMQLIRPLYFVKEEDIVSWQRHNNLQFLSCACKFTDSGTYHKDSKRFEIKRLISELCEKNPNVPQNIFDAAAYIDLRCVNGFKKRQ